jgi:hypothetical protein
MDAQAERLGLTKQQIQTDVELRLRKAAIRVEPPKDSNDFNSLYINVNILDLENGLFTYSARVEFQQTVFIPRLKKEFLVSTWIKASIGAVGRNKASFVRESVADLVDIFINDFLAVNPKP